MPINEYLALKLHSKMRVKEDDAYVDIEGPSSHYAALIISESQNEHKKDGKVSPVHSLALLVKW